jgi:hypothetical protein
MSTTPTTAATHAVARRQTLRVGRSHGHQAPSTISKPLARRHGDCHDERVTPNGPSPRPVREQDIAVLVGIIAVVEGALLGGEVGDETTTELARKLVAAGVLSENGNGLPSAGQVAVPWSSA